MAGKHSAKRSRKDSLDLEDVGPSSGDELYEAFDDQPRHAARVVLPMSVRYKFIEAIYGLLVACLLPVILVFSVRIFLVGQYLIPSASMENTLSIGDRVLTTQRLTLNRGNLHRGDVVVFRDPDHWLDNNSIDGSSNDEFLIKRLIGLPGDKVWCDGNGSPIVVNGQKVIETAYLHPGVVPSEQAFKVQVPPGHIFVLGDNRSNSADSRSHLRDESGGMVPVDNVVGVATMTCWPISHWKRLNTNRDVFALVPDENPDEKAEK